MLKQAFASLGMEMVMRCPIIAAVLLMVSVAPPVLATPITYHVSGHLTSISVYGPNTHPEVEALAVGQLWSGTILYDVTGPRTEREISRGADTYYTLGLGGSVNLVTDFTIGSLTARQWETNLWTNPTNLGFWKADNGNEYTTTSVGDDVFDFVWGWDFGQSTLPEYELPVFFDPATFTGGDFYLSLASTAGGGGGVYMHGTFDSVSVPEPSMLLLIGLGIGVLGLRRKTSAIRD